MTAWTLPVRPKKTDSMTEGKPSSTQTKTEKPAAPAKQKPDLTKKQKREQEAFKQKYFEYYDDIKISDRQDW